MTLKISICIATYKRPRGLAQLLNSLNRLEFHKTKPPAIEVIVVDNDANGSAQPICDAIRDLFQWSLVYSVEPHQGVTYARNHSVEMASDTADYLVFIDDDEMPASRWLDELLSVQATYNTDVVTGPVYPKFEAAEVPQWVSKGGFFDPPQHETGAFLNAAFTNNVLVNASLVRQMDVLFDSRFSIKGAEDTHFFMRLRKMGASIVWTQSATVQESIPSHRTTLPWLLERGFWGWSSYSLIEKELFPSPKMQLLRLIKGIGLIVTGMLTSLPSLLLGKHQFYKSILNIYRGLGTLSGLMGIQGNW